MATVKTTFGELLAAFGIKKGNYHEYRCEYTLHSGDLDAIYAFAENKLRKRTAVGSRFDAVPGPPHSGIHWYWDSDRRNALGEILVKAEVYLRFERIGADKIKVYHMEVDNVNCNARYAVEKGFLKSGLIKQFGSVE